MLDTKVVKILPNFAQGASFLALKVTKTDKIGVVRGCFYFERTVQFLRNQQSAPKSFSSTFVTFERNYLCGNTSALSC